MKYLLLFFCICVLQVSTLAQNTFVKTFADASAGSQVRILPTADQGFVVFTLDSLKLYKFNACGVALWAKQYQVPLTNWNSNDFIRTHSGGFAFLSRMEAGNETAIYVLTLDGLGNVLWSKTFEAPEYNMYPYTLNQDKDGNFVINANIAHFTNSPYFNLICKITPSGTATWAKRYEYGPIWGRSIVTSDNGVLARVGSTFLKTDADGNPQWASRFSASSEYYLAPVEVEDGYLFTSYQGASNKIRFQKMDKQGNLLWGHSKELSIIGPPPLLRNTGNGNFAAVFNHSIGSKKYTTLLEFDKGLNIVRQSAVALPGSEISLSGSDLSFAADGTPHIAGLVTTQGAGLFLAKLNDQYKAGCDTSIAIGVIAAQVSAVPQTPASQPFALQPVSRSIAVVNLPLPQMATACTTQPALALNIAGDTLLCSGGTATLQPAANTLFDSYEWSTGETSAAIQITQPGTYWLKATNSCRQESVIDSVLVTAEEFPQPPLIADTVLCSTQPVMLNAFIPDATYLWPDNSTNPTFAAPLPGNYTVSISWRGCTKQFSTQITDCEALVMPNVFTPNSDNLNDRFEPGEMQGLTAATLTVYNRWGQEIYHTQSLHNFSWNGEYSNQLAAPGLYYWHITYTNFRGQGKEQKGTVQLLL